MLADRHRRERRQARQGQARHRQRCSAARRSQHYHQAIAVVVADTFEQARAAAQLVQRRLCRATGRFDLAAVQRHHAKPPTVAGATGRYRDRRLRGRLRRGAGEDRRDLHDARREPRDDGAARHHRGVGRRPAHGLTSTQMVDWRSARLAATLSMPLRECPRRSRVHRRRLRRQAVPARDAILAALARARQAAGQGRADAPADVEHHRRIGRRRSSASAWRDARTASSPRSRHEAGRAICPAASRRRRRAARRAALCAPTG